MEKAVFGMDTLNITQGMNNSFSHKGTLAIDVAGKDTGIESIKAPFTGVIKRIYKGYVVWLESLNKVKYADGTEDYMTVMLMHDNDTTDLKVGQTIKQGQVFYQEGTTGYATGNHIHLSCGKGKFTGNGWYQNSDGNWCINNQYDITKALFVLNSCKIKNAGGYNWVKTDTYVIEEPKKELKSIDEVAQEVIAGKWGNGEERKTRLRNAGYSYTAVQTRVNELMAGNKKDTSVTYTVKAGDNLSKIAKKYNTTWQKIYEDNKAIIGSNPNLIKPGQKLIIK